MKSFFWYYINNIYATTSPTTKNTRAKYLNVTICPSCFRGEVECQDVGAVLLQVVPRVEVLLELSIRQFDLQQRSV